MRGVIQAAKPSQSGKTLGVQIGGTWYTTKFFELQGHVGKEIVGETEDSDYKGSTIHWLNEYSLVDGTTPQPNGKQTHTASVVAPMSQYQSLVSNLAAHLIAAGKDTKDLPFWFSLCKDLLEGKVAEAEDKEIPF